MKENNMKENKLEFLKSFDAWDWAREKARRSQYKWDWECEEQDEEFMNKLITLFNK